MTWLILYIQSSFPFTFSDSIFHASHVHASFHFHSFLTTGLFFMFRSYKLTLTDLSYD